jgi:hypothetical protein
MKRIAAIVVVVLLALWAIGSAGQQKPASPLAAASAVVPAAAASSKAQEPPQQFTGNGITNTPPFALVGGAYRLDWTVRGERACFVGGGIKSTDQRVSKSFGSRQFNEGGTHDGGDMLYGVPPGDYYLTMASSCPWQAVLTPQ